MTVRAYACMISYILLQHAHWSDIGNVCMADLPFPIQQAGRAAMHQPPSASSQASNASNTHAAQPGSLALATQIERPRRQQAAKQQANTTETEN